MVQTGVHIHTYVLCNLRTLQYRLLAAGEKLSPQEKHTFSNEKLLWDK